MKNLFQLLSYGRHKVEHLFILCANNKCIHYLCLLLFSPLICLAQSMVSGVVHEDNGKPLSFATVLLLTAKDSLLVKGAITTETGEYSMEGIQAGVYRMAVSMVGYQKVYSPLFTIAPSVQSIQAPLLKTYTQTQQLAEVTIVGEKSLFEQQLDRMVVNVQSSITSAGATALDVLERSPGISLNRQNNMLSLLGKPGVMIMVNGKLSRLPQDALLQMLSGMNAANIEKIELITTPPAGFDAEGNAGIINIVLKKNTDLGTNGAYSLTAGYGWYEKGAASLNLNHRTSKLNLFGDGSFSWNHFMFQIENHRRLVNDGQLIESSIESKRYAYQMSYNARIGFDYTLSTKTTLSGVMSGFDSRVEQFCHNHSHITHDREMVTHVYMQDHEINQWRNLMANLNLRHLFNNDHELTIDIDYLYFHHSNPHWYIINNTYYPENAQTHEQMNNSKLTPIPMWVGKADFVKNLGKHTKLETGVEGTFTGLNNKIVFNRLIENRWQIDQGFGQHVRMQEDIGAAYVNFQHGLSTKTKIQTGLRWEYTYTDLTSVDGQNLIKRRYSNLFPSAFLSQELSSNHSLQLSYSRRITRPTFNDLAPAFTFLDPYTRLFGNTSLKPTITNALQANYQLKKKFVFSFGYSHDLNAIFWTVRVDPVKNEQIFTKENIRSANTYSVSINIPLTICSWWHMQNNLMTNYQQNKTTYQGENIRIRGGFGRLNTTQNFTLTKGYSVELSCFYQTRSLLGIGYLKSFGSFNAGIQKKLGKDKGTIGLTGTDLLWTQRFAIRSINPQLNQDIHMDARFEPRVIRLTYSVNFGNKNIKAANKRKTASEEERNRVGN
jgi:hypothetical protein